MRKMKLQIETLAVDSFEAGADHGQLRGTVRGNALLITERLTCYTCAGSTCEYTGSPCVAC